MPFITVRNFSQMSEQTIFDTAVKHIGTTGKQSINKNGACQYGGTGCNAAPFLTNEGRKSADLMGQVENGGNSVWGALAQSGMVPNTHRKFMADLQNAHDNVIPEKGKAFKKEYDETMRDVAQQYGLNTKALDALGWYKL
ncbi:hypothetical protein Xoosp13_3 [Xanthomonas phage Xoo-sp13]|nr:hypothetical protein Xoosp13_3 [Xanthomonas phage Xoo-sp13]